MQNIDYHKIKYFHHVYQTKSLTESAIKLNLSKPALSLAIKSLEQELGAKLFDRTSKKMTPTWEGSVFFNKTVPLLSTLETAFLEIAQNLSSFQGTIRIGAPLCFGSDILKDYIQLYLEKYPLMNIQLHLSDGQDVFTKMKNGELDFAVVGSDFDKIISPGISKEKIFEYELVMVCSKTYWQKHLKNKNLQEALSGNRLLELAHIGEQTPQWFKLHYGDHRPNKLKFSVNNHHAHLTCLLDSMGVGLQSSYSVAELIKKGQLVEIRPSGKKLKYSFSFIQSFDHVPTKVLKTFTEGLRTYLKEI